MNTQMKQMLSRIAYPARGTPDESADVYAFAAEIQSKWSMSDLETDATEQSIADELSKWPDKFRAEAAELRKVNTPKATGGAIVYEDIASHIDRLLKPNDLRQPPLPAGDSTNMKDAAR
jgi:hypothetical protein